MPAPTLASTTFATMLVLGAFTLAPAAFATPTVGTPAPAFSATDVDGKTVSLADFKGKTVVLEWTNNGCPFVAKHYNSGNMQALQQAAQKDGVVWMTVASSAPGAQGHVTADQAKADVARWKATPARFLLDGDGKVGQAYGAQATPHMAIIDPAGNLAYAGAIDDKPSARVADVPGAKNYVSAALAELQAGKPVSTPATKAYGCVIKYPNS